MTLARDIIAGGQAELRVFEDRALGYLSTLPGTAPSPATSVPTAVRVPVAVRAPAPAPVPVPVPVAIPRPRRRLVPAAPLIAAAALLALDSGVLPHHVALGGTTGAPALSAAAMSSYERLATLARDGGSAAQLRAAAGPCTTSLHRWSPGLRATPRQRSRHWPCWAASRTFFGGPGTVASCSACSCRRSSSPSGWRLH